MTVWPNGTKSQPRITSGWGFYPGTRVMHYGTDFINFDYNCSTDDGVVVWAGQSDISWGAGIEVRVRHDNGYTSRYLHNRSVRVKRGQRVSAGQDLGVQGSTGDSDGKHLHYEVWVGHTVAGRTNPVPYLQDLITSTSGGGITPINPVRKVMPMFSLIASPDAGLIYVQGADGRREGVQSQAHLDALLLAREAMFKTGTDIQSIYFGDLTGNRGNIDWYLRRVNGPYPTSAEAQKIKAETPAPHVFSEEDIARIADKTVDEIRDRLGNGKKD